MQCRRIAVWCLIHGALAGFLAEVQAHCVAGIMRSRALDTSQAKYLEEQRLDLPGGETTVAVDGGGRRWTAKDTAAAIFIS